MLRSYRAAPHALASTSPPVLLEAGPFTSPSPGWSTVEPCLGSPGATVLLHPSSNLSESQWRGGKGGRLRAFRNRWEHVKRCDAVPSLKPPPLCSPRVSTASGLALVALKIFRIPKFSTVPKFAPCFVSHPTFISSISLSSRTLSTMSDRYQGSAYRGNRAPLDDRRYPAPPRHRDDDFRYGAPRDFGPAYYSEPRGYSGRGRRVHKAVPPPRPWDYSRRPPPRNDEERAALEREREAWEAMEAQRYEQRMEEQRRERERDTARADRAQMQRDGWSRDFDEDRSYRPPEYERPPRDYPPQGRRMRSRSPEAGHAGATSWGRTSVGSAGEGRALEARYPDAGYARRTPPHAAHMDAPDQPYAGPSERIEADAHATPRGPPPRGIDEGFAATPPTGPRGSGYSRRGGAPLPSPAFRGREGSGSTGAYTPGSDREREGSSYLSPSTARFPRTSRDGPPAAYRGGHPSYGRGRRDTNPHPYDAYPPPGGDEYHGGSSPHEASPFSPSTATPNHLSAPRLSRTSSAHTPTAAATSSVVVPHFSAAWKLTPELDAELMALEAARGAFVGSALMGAKRAAIRNARVELADAEMDVAAAVGRRQAAEKSLENARETADAYSLEENRKEEIQRLMAQQLQSV